MAGYLSGKNGRSMKIVPSATNDKKKTIDTAQLEYRIPGSKQRLIFSQVVLEWFVRHRQKRSTDTEVGGQLFAEITVDNVIIRVATGPYRCDRMRRNQFQPDISQERKDIVKIFKKGLHYVGNWHTHPEPYPSPSGNDTNSMAEYFNQSKHELNNFVLVIIGTSTFPAGLWVSLHGCKRWLHLDENENELD